MWKPKCCGSTTIKNIEPALQYDVTLYANAKNTKQSNNQQTTSFVSELKFIKRCHIIDRSTVAQESAINQNFKNAESTKEFICDYFDLGENSFTKAVWSGIVFKVLGVNAYSSYVIRGTRYNAIEGRYFVGILAGIEKL